MKNVQNPDAYKKRLEFFESADPGLTLAPLYARAIRLTKDGNRAAEALYDIGVANIRETTELAKRQLEHNEARLQNFQKLLAHADRALSDGTSTKFAKSLAEVDARFVLIGLFTVDAAKVNLENFVEASNKTVEAVPALIVELYDSIYYPDEGSFKLAAVKQTLNAIISSIPVIGNGYAIASSVYQVTERAKLNQAAAIQHARYVEDYCEAIERWTLAAATAILFLLPEQ